MNAPADIGFLLAWAVSVLKATMHWLAEAYEPPLLSAPTAYPNRIARHRQEAESRAPEATCVGCRLVYTDSVHFRNIQKDAGRSSNSRNPYWVVLVPLGKIRLFRSLRAPSPVPLAFLTTDANTGLWIPFCSPVR